MVCASQSINQSINQSGIVYVAASRLTVKCKNYVDSDDDVCVVSVYI